jgi:antibiotic biosynthesis monooxygenase (ABM) superfamily enzyme
MSAEEPISVVISSTVQPAREAEYEALLRTFVPRALTFPGHLGVHILKPGEDRPRDYHVVVRFAGRKQRDLFREWPEFVQFQAATAPLLERQPVFKEMTGLETWFTLPGSRVLRPLPRWKMMLSTLLGVYPTSLLLTTLVTPHLADWPGPLRTLVISLLMVALLTWAVMPLVTLCLRFWLFPAPDARPTTKGAEGGQPLQDPSPPPA